MDFTRKEMISEKDFVSEENLILDDCVGILRF
jgi:hypothetical protein